MQRNVDSGKSFEVAMLPFIIISPPAPDAFAFTAGFDGAIRERPTVAREHTGRLNTDTGPGSMRMGAIGDVTSPMWHTGG